MKFGKVLLIVAAMFCFKELARAFSIQVLTRRKGAMPKSMKQYGI